MLLLYMGDVIRNSIIAIIACYYYRVVMIIRNSIIAIIACYYYRVVMIIRNSIIAIIACYYCDSDSVLYSTSNVNDTIIIDIHIRLQ